MRTALRSIALASVLMAASCGGGSDASTDPAAPDATETTATESTDTTTTTEKATTSSTESTTTTTTAAAADRAEMSSAISAALAANRSMDNLGLNNDCAAEAIVDEVGLDGLADAGLSEPADAAIILAEDGDPALEIQGALFGALNTCADQKTVAESLQSEISSDLPISAESAQCMTKELFSGEGLAQLLGVVGGIDTDFEDMPPENQAFLVNLVIDCLTEEDLTALFAEGLAGDDFTAEQQECMGRGLARMESLPDLITSSISGEDLEFEALPSGVTDEIFGIVFGCISFGEIMAESMAESGVVMAQTEIDCVDEALEEAGFDLLLSEDQDQLTELLFGCIDF